MATSHQSLDKILEQNNISEHETRKALRFAFRAATANRVTLSADTTNTADAVMANLLTIDKGMYPNGGAALQGGKKYHLKGKIYCLSTTVEGIALDLGGGTATVTTGTRIQWDLATATTRAITTTTALATDATATTVVVMVDIDGYLVVSGGGSLILRFSSTTGTTGVVAYRGSWLEVREDLS